MTQESDMNKKMIRNLKRIKSTCIIRDELEVTKKIDFVICISKSKCKKTVTTIIIIGRYCLCSH